MKYFLLSTLLLAGVHCARAAEPAADSGALPTRAALCSTVLTDDDFAAGAVALEALAQQACTKVPELCVPDTANRDAFLRLNADLLAESAKISRPALEAFFKQSPQPNQCELYELAYIFDTLLLKRIADTVCAEANTALEKVQRLTDWTFEHVAVSSALQVRRGGVPGYPLNSIEQAHGFDFQVSWVLAALVQQQGLDAALAYLPAAEGAHAPSVLVLVFLEDGSVFADPARGLVWQDASTKKPIGITEALGKPKRIPKLHAQYNAAMARSIRKTAFRIPYHPLALLPKMKTVQNVLAETCAVRPVLYVDLARAHTSFGHLFCRVEGLESFRYNPELMEVTLQGREYSCGVWLLPLVQLFAAGLPEASQYRETRRMHLRGEFEQASLQYRRALSSVDEAEQRAELTFFLGLLEYDRGDYERAALALQRYLDRHYKSRQDHVRFLLARINQKQGNQGKKR
jgi:hypothetical protein